MAFRKSKFRITGRKIGPSILCQASLKQIIAGEDIQVSNTIVPYPDPPPPESGPRG